MRGLFEQSHLTTLKTTMDATQLRQRLIASNVANINTPGYKTQDVSFDEIFNGSKTSMALPLAKTHPKHMDALGVDCDMADAVFLAYRPNNPNDGVNDVDIDREMVKNSETSINFNLYSSILKKQYSGMKEVIDATTA